MWRNDLTAGRYGANEGSESVPKCNNVHGCGCYTINFRCGEETTEATALTGCGSKDIKGKLGFWPVLFLLIRPKGDGWH